MLGDFGSLLLATAKLRRALKPAAKPACTSLFETRRPVGAVKGTLLLAAVEGVL